MPRILIYLSLNIFTLSQLQCLFLDNCEAQNTSIVGSGILSIPTSIETLKTQIMKVVFILVIKRPCSYRLVAQHRRRK